MQELTVFVPEREEDITRWFAGDRNASVVKQNHSRCVWRAELGEIAVYVKRFPPQRFRDRARQEADMLRALQTGGLPETTGEDNLKTVRLVYAAYESARTGQTIELDTSAPRPKKD